MSFDQTSFTEEASSLCRSFTISQAAPGTLLQFDPPMHSKELAEAVHAYVPGPFTLQEKQRQVSIDFCSWRSHACPDGPASYFYDASPTLEFSSFSTTGPSFDSQSLPILSRETSNSKNQCSSNDSAPARRSRATKVAKKTTPKTVSSGSRLPGLSIMTKDGVDITDAGPRGPKTKEQREHAALMRKLQACPTCRRRKQKCNPSHHTQNNTSPSSTAATTSSCRSSAIESKASTPASSAVSGNSPLQRHSQEMQVSQTSQHFNGAIPPLKTALTPSDFSSFDEVLNIPSAIDVVDIDIGMDVFDTSFFDQSMLSTEFEAPIDQAFVDTVFDFNSWSDYQNGSLSSSYSPDSVPSQGFNDRGSILANSSQSLENASLTIPSFNADQFADFVPAWDSGSSPFVPVNGSRLQSPEEFGVQFDFSLAASAKTQLDDRTSFTLDPSHQLQHFSTHLNSLFDNNDYSSSNPSTPDMLTSVSMSANNSSQGQSLSSSGSPHSLAQSLALELRSPAPTHVTNTNDLMISGAAHTDNLSQSRSFASVNHHLQATSNHGFVEPHGDLTSYSPDNDETRSSPQLQTFRSMHTHSRPNSSYISIPQSSPTQALPSINISNPSQPIVSRSSIPSTPADNPADLQPRIDALDEVSPGGFEQVRMAPAIQYAWGASLERQSSNQDSFNSPSFGNESQQTTRRLNSASRNYLMHAMGPVSTMTRQEPRSDAMQSFSPAIISQILCNGWDVIPQRSSRPCRFSQVERSSFAQAKVHESSSRITMETPEVPQTNRSRRLDISCQSQQEQPLRQPTIPQSRPQALLRANVSDIRTDGQMANTRAYQPGMAINASSVINNRNIIRTEAHHEATVQLPTPYSQSAIALRAIIVKMQQILQHGLSSCTTWHGVLSLVIYTGFAVAISQLAMDPMFTLVYITSILYLRKSFSVFFKNTPSVNSTIKTETSRKGTEPVNGLRSISSQLTPWSTLVTTSRQFKTHLSGAMFPTQVLT